MLVRSLLFQRPLMPLVLYNWCMQCVHNSVAYLHSLIPCCWDELINLPQAEIGAIARKSKTLDHFFAIQRIVGQLIEGVFKGYIILLECIELSSNLDSIAIFFIPSYCEHPCCLFTLWGPKTNLCFLHNKFQSVSQNLEEFLANFEILKLRWQQRWSCCSRCCQQVCILGRLGKVNCM